MHAGGKGERETEETIWMPVSVLVLLKDIPNFPMLNIVLGYFEEGVDCFIRQELMGLRKLAFKTELEQKKNPKDRHFTSIFLSVSLFSAYQLQQFRHKKCLSGLFYLCQLLCSCSLKVVFKQRINILSHTVFVTVKSFVLGPHLELWSF